MCCTHRDNLYVIRLVICLFPLQFSSSHAIYHFTHALSASHIGTIILIQFSFLDKVMNDKFFTQKKRKLKLNLT
uniref:Uncharacterized protein n=1 Tax=Lutzomyia longipalpis TaxID=7200 RepID=A0A7G3B830_LUTLO